MYVFTIKACFFIFFFHSFKKRNTGSENEREREERRKEIKLFFIDQFLLNGINQNKNK